MLDARDSDLPLTPRPPRGLVAHRPRRDQAQAVAELVAAFELANDGESETTRLDVLDWWQELAEGDDAWVIAHDDGALVGYAELRREEPAWVADGYVHPAWNGRGVGSYIVALTEAHAAGRGGPERIRNTVAAADEAAMQLLAAAGYRPLRCFYRMAIDLPTALPAPLLPRGYRLAAVADGEERAFHAVLEAAFADDFGHVAEPFERWLVRQESSETTDRSLWLCAWRGGELAGVCQCARRFGGGWIGMLGVLPSHRGRGLGRSLLLQALHAFQKRGERIARLGVDAANPTGATALYRSVGMRVVSEFALHEKELARRPGAA